ncbi:MAG: Ig-like domain-containing protein [Solirubrobacteraceae bacterium]
MLSLTNRRMLSLLAIAAGAVALAAPAAAPAAEPGVVVSHLPLPGTADEAQTLDALSQLGARHIRLFAGWDQLEQTPGQFYAPTLVAFDSFVNKVRQRGIKVYFVVTSTPGWANAGRGGATAPDDLALYGSFIGRLAAHFRGRSAGYEIWNEPDSGSFWAGAPQPDRYAQMLKLAYPAVKQADPGARVITGALVGANRPFLAQLYANGAKGAFDAVGVHTDSMCARTSPDVAYREADGRVGRFAFTGYRELRTLMLDHGDDKPIWMTELGWSTTTARVGGAACGVLQASQANYIRQAYGCLAADPYVEVATVFNLRDYGPAESALNRYGLMSYAWAPKSAFAAFQSIAGGATPDPGCGASVDRGAPELELIEPVNDTRLSGTLNFKGVARDSDGSVVKTELLVDGRVMKASARSTLTFRWFNWRRLRNGPHTITFRAKDSAQNVSTRTVTVFKVNPDAGEAIRTSLRTRITGRTNRRYLSVILGAERDRTWLRGGRVTLQLERLVGRRWVPFGGEARYAPKQHFIVQRSYGAGTWRVRIRFTGYKAFTRTGTARRFTVTGAPVSRPPG